MQDKLLFFSTVDDNPVHQRFVFSFIASALITHPNASCEVRVSDHHKFQTTYRKELAALSRVFPERCILIDKWPNKLHIPKFVDQPCAGSLVRFLTLPDLGIFPYTYISDIDMLFVEDILPAHKSVMTNSQLPYTNIIRKGTMRLTGCMMVRSMEYYEALLEVIVDYVDNPEALYYPILNDEEMLYKLIGASSLPLPDRAWPETYRPISTIHTSVHRKIDGSTRRGVRQPGWGCTKDKLSKAEALFSTPEWQALHFPPEYMATVIRPIKEKIAKAKKLMLNLGCGKGILPGFVNIDTKAETGCDLLMNLNDIEQTYPPQTVDRIVSYHVLEHMTEADGDALLRSCYRILRGGGELYMEMPEFDRVVENYLRQRTLMSKHRIFGLGRDEYDHHRWGYNFVGLAEKLRGMGFIDVRRRKAHDHHAVNNMCFGIEARKGRKENDD